MKIKKQVNIVLDDEKNKDETCDGTIILAFTGATIKEILCISSALKDLVANLVQDLKLSKKEAGDNSPSLPRVERDRNKKGSYRGRLQIPVRYQDDKVEYMRCYAICRAFNMPYPEALKKMNGQGKGAVTKSDPEVPDIPADPQGNSVQKEKTVRQPVEKKPPAKKRTSPSKQPADPPEPKSMYGFTVGDKVHQISGSNPLPGTGTVIDISDRGETTGKIEVKFFNNIRWLLPDQIERIEDTQS